jgi:hypothetical protein
VSWDVISGLTGCAFTLFSGLNLWMNNQIRLKIADLKLEIERTRNEDKDEMREWVEDRYQPRPHPSSGRKYASN